MSGRLGADLSLFRILYRAILRETKDFRRAYEQCGEKTLTELVKIAEKANAMQWTKKNLDSRLAFRTNLALLDLLESDEGLKWHLRQFLESPARGMEMLDPPLTETMASSAAWEISPNTSEALRRRLIEAATHDWESGSLLDHVLGILRALPANTSLYRAVSECLLPLPRPHSVLYDVGDVLEDQSRRWMGVVFGWDGSCRMPEEWVRRNGVEDKVKAPFYHLLCCDGAMRYASQLSHELRRPSSPPLEKAPQFRSFRRTLSNYFVYFDGEEGRYVPNEHLRRRYPPPSVKADRVSIASTAAALRTAKGEE